MGCAPLCPPGVGESNPKGLLNTAPSNEKLLNWSFLPPKELPLAVGSNRVKSCADREIVGSFVSCLLVTLVTAPVLSPLKVPAPSETTITSPSASASSVNVVSKVKVLPNDKKHFFLCLSLKP